MSRGEWSDCVNVDADIIPFLMHYSLIVLLPLRLIASISVSMQAAIRPIPSPHALSPLKSSENSESAGSQHWCSGLSDSSSGGGDRADSGRSVRLDG